MSFNAHSFALHGQPVPPVDETKAIHYLVGSNGTLARSSRPGLEVGVAVGVQFQQARGLAPVAPYVRFGLPRVPRDLVALMLSSSRAIATPTPTEALFYLSHGELPAAHGVVSRGGWHLEAPAQRATAESVEPAETGSGTATERAIIEVHSHHHMAAEFSAGDDVDELGWFRVYAVIGRIFTRPEIRARVALFGHAGEFSAAEFFELPEGLVDCVA